MTAISTYQSYGSTFSSVPPTGAVPSQGAVLSFSSPIRKTYTMYYGTKSATFTPTPYPKESSGTYHLTTPVKITKPEVARQSAVSYQKNVTPLKTSQVRIYGNTTSEMSVYKPGNNTAAAWYSPTKGKIVTGNTFCPTCPQSR
ncbi:MAG: hypothetical protein LBF88_10980 [Planctomycetaceae bacterium]|jgi:hypothetical protein|nr:hypothetical protein [Planctomycetaceae bacterium]